MEAEQQVSALLLDAAVLMLVGMGVVFGFLMLLVWAVQIMSGLVRTAAEPLAAATASSQPGGISPAVVAAISAAIEHHHKQQKGQK